LIKDKYIKNISVPLLLYVSVICIFLLPACVKYNNVNLNSITVDEMKNEKSAAKIDPVRVRAAEIAASLDDRLLAAQVLICGIDGKGSLPPHMKTLLSEHPPGGVMMFKYNLDSENDAIRALISETESLITDESGLPPFIAVDHEGGTVNRFRRGVASLPAASSYWELFLAESEQQALLKITADSIKAGLEIKSLGFNMNFAPVAEYLNENNRDFLESRSYGPVQSFTAEAAAAFVRGMRHVDVLCVIKHFPGSAGNDPHYSLSTLNADKFELGRLVYPFAFLIDNGARAVMVAHTLVPAMDDKIASLSPVVMRNWLREELGFDGIIISDDFIMAAAAGNYSPEEAAVLSVAAGADMVLAWPSNLSRTHRSFVSALEDGRLPRERLLDAAQRVIYEKLKMGLINGEEN
jgi:beta-N-acetylhexosaminidase